MDWTKEHSMLRDELAALYGQSESAKRVVREADLDFRQINFNNNALNTWQEILEYAIKQEKVDAIVEIAKKEYPQRSKELGLAKSEQASQEVRRKLLNNLSDILADCQLQEADLVRYWRASFPISRAKQLKFSNENKIVSMAELFERTYKKPYDRRGYPAILFAHIVNDQCGGYTGLTEWAESVQEQLDLEVDEDEFIGIVDDILDMLDNPESAENAHLLVEVIQDGSTQLKVQTFWGDDNGNSAGLISCETHELAAEIRKQISDNIHIIGERKLIIEVFLPLDLMDVDLEFASEKEESLIVDHIVVRRIWERNKRFSKKTAASRIQEAGFKAWKDRWKKFNRTNRKIRGYHYWIEQKDLKDLSSFSIRLIRDDKICCTTPEISPGDDLQPLINQHMKAGIPVIIWSGITSDRMRNVFDSQLDTETIDVLSRVWDLQAKSLYAPEQSISDLHIIYDDPDRPLPSSNTNR